MKRIILLTLLLLALLAPGISKAQIDKLPNYGFEQWTSPSFPNQWDTVSGVIKKGFVYNGARSGGMVQRLASVNYTTPDQVTHTLYPHEGSYFVELATVANSTVGVHAGYIKTKFPYTKRAPYFYANILFAAAAAGEGPVFGIVMTHWNTITNSRDTILKTAAAISNQGAIIPWTTAYLNLSNAYSTTTGFDPDTAIVVFQSSSGVLSGGNISFANGTALFVDNAAFSTTQPTGIEMTPVSKLAGVSVYPNPFSGITNIHYVLSETGHVNLSVYDLQGKLVSTLVNGNQALGIHDVTFQADGIKNGIYFYRLQSGNSVETGKLILNK